MDGSHSPLSTFLKVLPLRAICVVSGRWNTWWEGVDSSHESLSLLFMGLRRDQDVSLMC